MTFAGCVLEDNSAFQPGGYYGSGAGLISQVSDGFPAPDIFNCTFTGNSADFGAGLFLYGHGVAHGCRFDGNSAKHEGGGVFVSYSDGVQVVNSTFTGNSAEIEGGAISVNPVELVEIAGCTATGNSAPAGGAVFSEGRAKITNAERLSVVA